MRVNTFRRTNIENLKLRVAGIYDTFTKSNKKENSKQREERCQKHSFDSKTYMYLKPEAGELTGNKS